MGWISPKEALRRYKQRRKTRKLQKLAVVASRHDSPSTLSTAVDPFVDFSRKEIILKTCTPVKPPANQAKAVTLRRSSMDLWDRLDEDRREIAKINQHTSPVLRLPPEVRNMIYTHALGGRTYRFKDTIPLSHARLDTKGSPHTLALLFVCHQIYSEASLLPYSLNTFSFREFKNSFNPFLDRRQYPQFQAITKIELVTYQAERMWAGPHDECDIVKEVEQTKAWERLPQLRDIRVVVDLNESLHVVYGSRDFRYSEIRENQGALEEEVMRWRPTILVRFFWA